MGSRSGKHILALDGIRGIAVLLVMVLHLHHILRSEGVEGKLLAWFEFGWSGVDLFFVLSGFLITGILLDSRNSSSYFRTFYARRALRIFPLYYVFLIGAVLLDNVYLIVPSVKFAHVEFWRYFVYLGNWAPTGFSDPHISHLWSLAVEEQFYLVWPFIVWLVPARRLAPLCLFLAVVSLVLRCLLAPSQSFAFVFRATFLRMDTLALGAFMAIAIRDYRWGQFVRRVAVPGMAVAIAVYAAIVAFDRNVFWQIPMSTFGVFDLAILFALAVFTTADSKGAPSNFLSKRWLTGLGKYSYALYIFHPVVFGITSRPVRRILDQLPDGLRVAGAIAYVPLMILLTYGIARLSWVFFEAPILSLKRYFPYGDRGRERVAEMAITAP